MTVAFWDIITLTDLLHPENVPSFEQSDLVMKQLSRFHWQRKNHSSVINILAQALYEIFSAGDDWDLATMREACFEYFRLGGICADHPIGLLSG
jgi:squalene monooxygenase